MLGGRQVSTERPRGRSSDGAEIELDTWKAFSSADLLNSLVVERMLAGVATRRHADVAEPRRRRPRGALQVDVQVGRLAALRGGDDQGHGRADGPEPL